MRTLLQLVPRIPPPPDGVGATAQALAHALRLAGQSSDMAIPRALDASWQRLAPDVVLLHYVNYGYDRDGCPGWLVDEMEAWLAQDSKRALWVYFHEVYASGPPWSWTFWRSHSQRRLAARLAQSSALSLTSLMLYRELLVDLGVRAPVAVRPIVSSVGEPETALPFSDRPASLAVFGSPGVRARAYGPSLSALECACRELAIEEVLDLGPRDVAPFSCAGRPVHRLGELAPEDVSRHLRAARAGFLAYPLDFLSKSSVFAAYAAHGILPICTGRRARRADDPKPGVHYWDIGSSRRAPEEPGALAVSARAWYKTHDLSSLASFLVGQIEGA